MHIITFDIEDWYLSYPKSDIDIRMWDNLEYRTEKNTELILDFLAKHTLKATFFFLGYEVKKNPALLKRVFQAGHEVGYHSFYHKLPHQMGRDAFRRDIVEGVSLIEDLIGEKVIFYRAPLFSVSNQSSWVHEILLENGIKVSSSIRSGVAFQGSKAPSYPFVIKVGENIIFEFPLPGLMLGWGSFIYSGGGYFRLLPLNILQKVFSHGNYQMLYFHPRDFDKSIPSSALLPFYRNLMNRTGNGSTIPKLEHLISRYSWISLGDAYNFLQKNFA